MTDIIKELFNCVKILTLNGEYISLAAWQQQYGLQVGSTQIGRYFRYTERKFREDLQDYGELIVCEPLMIVMDEYRRLKGSQVHVTSFNRNEAKQAVLRAENKRRATISPHVFKMAADLDCENEADVMLNVPTVRRAADNKNILIRMGYKDYLKEGWSFIHLDVCPEYFGKGKVWNSRDHPAPWENEITW